MKTEDDIPKTTKRRHIHRKESQKRPIETDAGSITSLRGSYANGRVRTEINDPNADTPRNGYDRSSGIFNKYEIRKNYYR